MTMFFFQLSLTIAVLALFGVGLKLSMSETFSIVDAIRDLSLFILKYRQSRKIHVRTQLAYAGLL
jgi:hypothetical protein